MLKKSLERLQTHNNAFQRLKTLKDVQGQRTFGRCQRANFRTVSHVEVTVSHRRRRRFGDGHELKTQKAG